MAAEPPPNAPDAPSGKTLARTEDRSTGAMASRGLLAMAGMGLLIGFFMPWIRFGNMVVLSGFSLWASSGEAVEVISGPRRALLFMVPLSAIALMVCAYVGHKLSIWVALIASTILLGYGAFTIIRLFVESTGVGMWMVVGSAMLTFAVALIGLGSSRSRDERS